MEKAARVLTEYIIGKGMIGEADKKTYEYGFVVALEIGSFVSFSIFMALYLNLLMEGIIFFIIFVPLRSYAGGLHLKKFCSCFVLSCLIYVGALLLVKNNQISAIASFVILLALEVMVYGLYPVEHVNRRVDKEENDYFKNKLMRFLCMDLAIGIICLFCKWETILLEEVLVFVIVTLTMVAGKYKNRYCGRK